MELLDCIAGLLFFLFFFCLFIVCFVVFGPALFLSHYFFSFCLCLFCFCSLSNEHGFFLANVPADPRLQKLINGMPQCCFLQNLDNDLRLLVPIARPLRLSDPQDVYTSEVLFLRNDREWWSAIHGVRYHAYPIHLTLAFLSTTTLSSALYLLILYSLSNQYDAAFRIADACICDTQLTSEERQTVVQLQYLAEDPHPDAHALKVKLTAVMTDTAMPALPWTAKDELAAYYRCRQHVSATCRLTAYEEYQIMNLLGSGAEGLESKLGNRFNIVRAIVSGRLFSCLTLHSPLFALAFFFAFELTAVSLFLPCCLLLFVFC